MTRVVFRRLQLGDAEALDDAQRIKAREDFTFAFDYEPGQDLSAYLVLLEDCRLGLHLAPTSVPSTFEVGLLDARIAVRVSVRHAPNEFLLQQGEHIGHGVLPEFRGLGLGTAALLRGLEIARNLGASPALVTCDDDNPASRHIIEKAGGRYESSYSGVEVTVQVRRYWFGTPRVVEANAIR